MRATEKKDEGPSATPEGEAFEALKQAPQATEKLEKQDLSQVLEGIGDEKANGITALFQKCLRDAVDDFAAVKAKILTLDSLAKVKPETYAV